MLRVPQSFLIVKPEKEYRDQLEIKGLDGLNLQIDTTFNPEYHRVTTANVVAIPGSLSNDHISHEARESDIIAEVRVGDQAYFHYNVLTEENALITPEGKVYRVPYPRVFAVKRDGELIMIGGWCFVEPCYPEGVERVDTPLGQAFKKGFLFLPEGSVKAEEQVGILRYIGRPLKNKPTLHYKAGDKVILTKYCDFKNTVEGKEYYALQQSEILGTI